MQQEEAPNMKVVKLVNWAAGVVSDVSGWYGVNATDELDSMLLESMAPILREASGVTMTGPFVQCCKYGFRGAAIEILRSGQVSLYGLRDVDGGIMGFLEKFSIPIDEIPDLELRLKLKRMQRGKQAFGM
jgi:hypothetical protein